MDYNVSRTTQLVLAIESGVFDNQMNYPMEPLDYEAIQMANPGMEPHEVYAEEDRQDAEFGKELEAYRAENNRILEWYKLELTKAIMADLRLPDARLITPMIIGADPGLFNPHMKLPERIRKLHQNATLAMGTALLARAMTR